MMEVLDDQPKGKQDYDVWISDGVALGKGKNQGKATSKQLFQFPYKAVKLQLQTHRCP